MGEFCWSVCLECVTSWVRSAHEPHNLKSYSGPTHLNKELIINADMKVSNSVDQWDKGSEVNPYIRVILNYIS